MWSATEPGSGSVGGSGRRGIQKLPVEKSEICMAPTDQLLTCPRGLVGKPYRLAPQVAAAEEVKRDALRTCRPAVPACSAQAR